MEQYWLKKEGNPHLILFALGWAASPNAVAHICPAGYDVLALCHYTSLSPLSPADFGSYRRIYLFAWSFGIWVSEQICRHLPLHKAIAINGTPYPIDPHYGMRLKVVFRTMRALAKSGSNAAAEHQDSSRYMPTGPYPERTIDDKIDELENLAAWSKVSPPPSLHWDKAYIADKDEIFPPEHMEAYWGPLGLGTRFESYHYPFNKPEIVLNELKDE